jgi:hypothetical protein
MDGDFALNPLADAGAGPEARNVTHEICADMDNF